jgi:polyphosphate kinase
VIDELYDASQAGAKIDLIVRGICALRPGVKGMSENITVRSILGRFLEHSRVYSFDNGDGESSWLMGSADLMPRNLDNRLELVIPIENERLRSRLASVFAVLLADNRNAWELDEDAGWRRLRPGKGERARPTHDALIRVASRSPRRSAARRQ